MKVTSIKDARDIKKLVGHHDFHVIILESLSKKDAIFSAELSPDETKRVLDFILGLKP